MEEIWLLILNWELCPRLTIAITEEIPIMIPSIVSNALVLFRKSALYAIFNKLNVFI